MKFFSVLCIGTVVEVIGHYITLDITGNGGRAASVLEHNTPCTGRMKYLLSELTLD